jgi:4-hydroxybenzoate polyprenyltransferase
MGEGERREALHMFSTFISAVFWSLFPIGSVAMAACLIAVHLKNASLTTARWHHDDGADEGTGYEIFRLTRVSDRLTNFASVLGACLIVTAFVGTLGGTGLKMGAIIFSIGIALATDHVRTRHARLEEKFERLSGQPLKRYSRGLGGIMTHA